MKKYLLIFTLFLFVTSPFNTHNAQAMKTSDSKEFFYNLSIGAIIGGIGAIINKKPEQKFEKVLLKGVCQGALGGYVTFESKRLVRAAVNNNDYKLLWAAKIVNAGGISIKENASMNKNFWEKWHINIGFNRIEFDLADRFKVHYKIMPVALVYTIGVASQTKFELGKSLSTGEFIFSSNSDQFAATNSLAKAFPGNIVLHDPYKNEISTVAHEIIHIYQQNDFSQLDTFMAKPVKYLNSKSKTLNTINNYIYYDFRHLTYVIFYTTEYKKTFYYDNLFEREAGFFSNTFDEWIIRQH